MRGDIQQGLQFLSGGDSEDNVLNLVRAGNMIKMSVGMGEGEILLKVFRCECRRDETLFYLQRDIIFEMDDRSYSRRK